MLKRAVSWLDKLSGVGRIGVVSALLLSGAVVAGSVTSCTQPVTTKQETVSQSVSFEKKSIKDGSQDIGSSKIKTVGVNGEKQVTSEISLKCAKEVSRKTLSEQIIKQPVAKEDLVGTKHQVTETETIPFEHNEVINNFLSRGQKQLQTAGVNGTRTLTYAVAENEGEAETKTLINSDVTTQPINEVTGVGPQCDPNYSGACVPNVYPSDVDCGSGSGNGPYYVYGTVRVIGNDRYGLDRDGNGYGCE